MNTPAPRPATGALTTSDDTAPRMSIWAPLSVPIFRALWLTALVSNIGTWMQTVGAQWFMVEQHTHPLLIALIQTASAAPVLLLGIPAGVLGEFLNRRSILIWMQTLQVLLSAALVTLTATGEMTPYLLLLITVLLGAATAVQLPAYQALATEIVPRRMVPMAASLSAVSVNVARAIGPAVAGVLLSGFGVAFVFGMNLLSFAAFLIVLVTWRSYRPNPHQAERFIDAARAGLRYVTQAAVVRRMYVRLGAFVVPASVLYALLPLIATQRLSLDSAGYGLLLAGLGVGSVGAAFLVPWFRTLGANRTVLLSSALFGAATIGVALSPWLFLTLPILAVAGAAWIGVVATLNGAVQSFLPVWVRARGLSVYQMVLYGAMAAGGLASGLIAGWIGAVATSATAGAATLVVAASQLLWPLLETADKKRDTFALPLADAVNDIDGKSPTLVLVRYDVAEEQEAAFVQQMSAVEHSRRRTGARTWALYQDREDGTWVEAFGVGSWSEHLQQHQTRLTQYDRVVIETAGALALSVDVNHLIEHDSVVGSHTKPRPHHATATAPTRREKTP